MEGGTSVNKIDRDTTEGLVGRKLTDDEVGVIEWLNGWEDSTVRTVKGLLEAAHRFGYISGEHDHK